jgi:mono/diheme cytochrome c family protein
MARVILGCLAVALAGIAWVGTGHLRAAAQEGSVAAPPAAPASSEAPTSAPAAASPHRALLNRYCVTCHNQRLATAGLKLDTPDVDRIGIEDAATWEKVIRKVRAGQMPPSGRPRPEKAVADAFVAYLETELDRSAAAHPNPGRRPAFHRLNRAEYSNAVRDLLAVDIDAAAFLPVDDAGHGFDNVAELLSVSPLLVEGYVSAASRVSRLAVGDPTVTPFTETYAVPRQLVQDDRVSEDLPFGSRGGAAVPVNFPLDGEYVVKVRLQRNKDNFVRGLNEPHQLDVRLDGVLIKRFSVGGEHKARSGPMNTFADFSFWGEPAQQDYEFSADVGLEVRFPAKAGPHVVGVAFLDENMVPENEVLPEQTYHELVPSGYKGGIPLVDSVAITGPYNSKGLSDTPSRRTIFVCTPRTAAEEGPCAERIVARLARRAYRRPVTKDDVEPLLAFYSQGREEEGFEGGIRLAVQRLLVSPDFLFRREQDPASAAPGTVYRVSDIELASRLSFFLWSSMPDDELLDLAEKGKLKNPATLERQVDRMLGDPRSQALVRNFVGQWLSLRKLQTLSPDPVVAPDFDENLREALRQETELFFESILREDRSVLDVLDADYTFLNERLARHYGISDVVGSHFRRVALNDAERRGLLGHGSLLTVTSYANRTAPTLRGAWILESLLGTPPPPPPPNVPSLNEEARGADSRTLTMRERMDQHRVNPTCASCHRVMDPLGFALENFDSLGKWRDSYDGTPIDASGVLPDGGEFEGPTGLRKVLLDKPEQFVHTFMEKLLTYALGRGVEHYDATAIRSIMREAAGRDYRLRALIQGIVKSSPFQMRRVDPS